MSKIALYMSDLIQNDFYYYNKCIILCIQVNRKQDIIISSKFIFCKISNKFESSERFMLNID